MVKNIDSAEKNPKSIAVFDVGKTNKKLVVFNHRLEIVEALSHTFDEYDYDDIRIEAAEEAAEWLIASLQAIALRHDIGAISIATHGSAFACLDEMGKLALPIFAYTTDPGPAFHERFSADFGDPVTLQKKTMTPDIPGLGCMAKGIRFAQERYPDRFKKTAAILPLPQYYGYILTGQKGIDPTYPGSHTCLWDFGANDWSFMTDRLGIRALLPQTVSRPWDSLGKIRPDIARRTGLLEDTIVTVGIHDSNASLLPYLIKAEKDFVVNSTGTVTVSMCPAKKAALTDAELGRVVFYNLSAFKTPIKTTIFLGGMEFDTYLGLLSAIHPNRGHAGLVESVMARLLEERRCFVLPSFVPFGMFPGSAARIVEGDTVIPLAELFGGKHPAFFADYEKAYTTLILSTALQAEAALAAAGLKDGMRLFIEGGFARNEVYTALVAALFPKVKTAVTNLEEATAFGAALLGKAALMGADPRELSDLFTIEARDIPVQTFAGLAGYREEFLRLVEKK